MAPLIGVTPCRALTDCLEAIRRVGGDPRPLDFAADQPGHVTKDLSGLLLSHGGDIDPTLYGEEQDMAVQDGLRERERDTYELEIVCRALDVDLPMLGICRWIQVLNVACGGTLIQDIRTKVPGALEHQIREPRYAIAHEVWITNGSRLWDVMGEPLGQGDWVRVTPVPSTAVTTKRSDEWRTASPSRQPHPTASSKPSSAPPRASASACSGIRRTSGGPVSSVRCSKP